MDEKKLKALREKYGNAAGDVVFDPKFKAVADKLFKDDGSRSLPYGGLPTFMDLKHVEDFSALDIAVVGVPMDLGVTNRPGARFGPRAIRGMERIGPYNHALEITPDAACKVADVGDVPFRSRFNLEHCIEDIEAHFRRLTEAGVRTLAIGGDHSISYPILKAIAARHGPVAMVHIDAHCDTSGEYDGSKFHHGGPFRLAVLDGLIDPERTIQIGIRGSAEFLWELSYEAGMTVIHVEEFTAMGVGAVIEKARAVVGDGPVYVTFDVDGLGEFRREVQQLISLWRPSEIFLDSRPWGGFHLMGMAGKQRRTHCKSRVRSAAKQSWPFTFNGFYATSPSSQNVALRI
ncbi:MAG: arginase family protein [Alphaproteobacteria bacterium]